MIRVTYEIEANVDGAPDSEWLCCRDVIRRTYQDNVLIGCTVIARFKEPQDARLFIAALDQ